MYTEWASLAPTIASNINGAQSNSVLTKLSGAAGRDVAIAVVKPLSNSLGIGGIGISPKAEPSGLTTDQEVLWCMDVICYGLSLPLTEQDIIKECVNVYCEWLTVLHPEPKISVPKPISDDPNVYARKIISHLHNLFVPRSGEGADIIKFQVLLCHRVLRTLQNTAQKSEVLTRETWESLLLFLLAINDILLAPPVIKDDVGDQLCERVLSALFEVWLLACVRSFPSPSLWKTFQESCAMWRHRITLIEQWNRANLVLTARLIEFTYGPTFPELKILEEDSQLIPSGMTNDCVAQSWYRFLRIIGSPIALCCPQVISRTPQFMQYVLLRQEGLDPNQHPCLLMLPQIFLKAIKGLASQVDAFLGIYQPILSDETNLDSSTDKMSTTSVNLATGSTTASSNSGGTASKVSGVEMRQSTSLRGDISTISVAAGGIGISSINNNNNNNNNLNSSSNNNNNNTSNIPSSTLIDNILIPRIPLPHSPTPPLQRRLAKSFSVAPSSSTFSSSSQPKGLSKSSLIGLTSSRSSTVQPLLTPNSGPPSSSTMLSLNQENRPPLAPTRPKCNSILHLFGEWLFEAAHIGGETWIQNTKKQATEASRRPSSMIMDNRKGSLSLSQPTSLSESTDVPSGLTIDKYESGRAEAIGALCRIFCAKKTGEEILPVYLARFYMALQQGLKIPETRECEESLASILYNSADLFRVDLDGVQVLLPAFISALELVLPEKDLKIKSNNIILNKIELRRASIHILLSILVLPLHFQTLPIRDLNAGSQDKMITFAQLKPRLINILMNALQVETDPQNTHMLLGGLLLSVQDSVSFEDTDNNADMQTSPTAGDSNLLSSACSEKSAYSIASAASNSSIGGNSTATLSNDLPSLTISDDFPADLLHDFEMTSIYDSAHALFVRSTYLVCHRLISSWKTDLNVSLAALELLSGLARMHIKDSDALECKRAVKWICDYICYQCSRPPPAHSKDLHSTIVAAFQCTSAWLMQNPYLLQDKDCLTTVLEVVELGISGSKSVGKPGEPIKLKDEKDLKPVSMRVRDAAENLLTVIMEQVGYFPNECGPQSLSSLLDEVALVKHCNLCPENGSGDSTSINQEQAVQKFKYFVTENSTVLALLDEALGNDQDPQPTVTLLIRGPFGRHAWTMQLRHLPRSKSGTKYHAPNPGRPVPMNEMPLRHEPDHKYFPESVERVPPCIADYSIPTLDSILQKIGSSSTKQLYKLLEDQVVYEKLSWAQTECSVDGLGHAQEAIQPAVCQEFQAARLFLSHFGFLSLNQNTPPKLGEVGQLTVLNMEKPGFSNDLQILDKMSSRTCDTIHIFYVKVGQTTEQEIIGNMNLESVRSLDPHFWTMLTSLGKSVSVDEHSGWTGSYHTSWRINNSKKNSQERMSHEDFKFNGEKKFIYWADVGSEMAFVVPTHQNRVELDNLDGSCLSSSCGSATASNIPPTPAAEDANQQPGWYERSVSDANPNSNPRLSMAQKARTLSLDLDKQPTSQSIKSTEPVPPSRRRVGVSKASIIGSPSAKILLVWLESYEDYLTFPKEELLSYTRTGEESQHGILPRANDCHIIFLHALNSSLLRVKLQGPTGRMNLATPLVDGMVISKRVLGTLIRQTAYNMAKRRRLDNDAYQPPHVRRRLKVQDMIQKYKLNLSEPELLAHLFKAPT